MMVEKARNSPRKFGTDLSKSQVANAVKSKAASRSQSKTSSNKIVSNHGAQYLSIELEGTNRNLEKDGSFRCAELSSSKAQNIREFPLEDAKSRSVLIQSPPSNNAKMRSSNKSSTKRSASTAKSKPMLTTPSLTSSTTAGSCDSSQLATYTVEFDCQKPFGMQLEPVIKSSARQIGCRVVRFIDDVVHNIDSAARASGKVSLGDIVVAVDGVNVLSQSYSQIIDALKLKSRNGTSTSKKRTIKFRKMRISSEPTLTKEGLSEDSNGTEASKVPMQAPGSTKSAKPTRKNLYLEDFVKEKKIDGKERMELESFPDSNVKKDTKETGLPTSSFQNTPLVSETKLPRNATKEPGDENLSPSSVRKLVQSSSSARTTESLSPPQSNNVVRTLHCPETIREIIQKSMIRPATSLASSTVAMTARAVGELLVGHSKEQFQDAVRLKHELLQELSQAKADLGEDRKKCELLEQELEELRRDRDVLRMQSMMTCSGVSTDSQGNMFSSGGEIFSSSEKEAKHREDFLDETLSSLSLQDQVGTLRRVTEDQRKRITLQLRQLLKQKDEIESLSSKLQQQESDLVTSKEALHDVRFSLRISTETSDHLKSDLSKVKESHGVRVKYLEERIRSLQLQGDAAKQREEKMKSDMVIKDNAVKNLGNALKVTEQRKNTVESELKDLQSNLSDAMDRLMHLESDLQLARSEAISLNKALLEKSQQVEAIYIDLEDARLKHEKLNVENSSLTGQLQYYENEIRGLRSLLDGSEEKASEFRETSERQKNEVQSLTDDLADRERIIGQLKHQIDFYETEKQDMLAACQSNAVSLIRLEEEKQRMIHAISEHEKTEKGLTDELSNISAKYAESKQDIISAKHDLFKLKCEISESEKYRQNLEQENERLRQSLVEAESSRDSIVQSLQAQISNLKESLRLRLEEADIVQSDWKSKVNHLDHTVKVFEESSREMKAKLQEQSFQLMQRDRELKCEREEIQKFKDNVDHMQQQNSQICEEATSVQSQLKEELNTLRNGMFLLQNENSALKVEKEMMTAESMQLANQLRVAHEAIKNELSEKRELQERCTQLTAAIDGSNQRLAYCERKLDSIIDERDLLKEDADSKILESQRGLKEIESLKAFYKANCDTLQQSLDAAMKEQKNLEHRISKASDFHKSEISQKEAAIQKLQLDLNDATKIIASKEVELRDQMEKILLLSEESDACITLKNENAELLLQADAMDGQLRNSAKELDLLRNSLQEAELCKGSMQNEIEVLQNLHHQAEVSLNAATSDMKAAILIYEEKLQHQANKAAAVQSSLNATIDRLQHQICERSSEGDATKLENLELAKKLVILEQGNALLCEKISSLEMKLRDDTSLAANDTAALQLEKEAMAAENIELHNQLYAAKEAIKVELSEKKELQERCIQLTDEIEAGNQRIKANCDTLQQSLDAAIKEQKNLEHRISKASDFHKSEISQKEAAIQKLQLDLNDATKIIASKEVELRDQMEKILLLSEESDACITLKNENAELLLQADAMDGQLRNSAKELDLLRNSLQEAELCKGSMQNEIEVLQNLHHQAEVSLNAATSDMKAAILIYEEKLQHQANKAAAVQSSLNATIDRLQHQICERSSEGDATKLENLELAKKLVILEQGNALLCEKISSLEMKLRDDTSLAANDTAALQLEKEAMAAENIELHNQLHAAKEAIKVELSEKKELQERCIQLTDEIEASFHKLACFENEKSLIILERDALRDDAKRKSAVAFSAVEDIEAEFHRVQIFFNQVFSKKQCLEAQLSEMEQVRIVSLGIHEAELSEKEYVIKQMQADLDEASRIIEANAIELRQQMESMKHFTEESSKTLKAKDDSYNVLLSENSELLFRLEALNHQILGNKADLVELQTSLQEAEHCKVCLMKENELLQASYRQSELLQKSSIDDLQEEVRILTQKVTVMSDAVETTRVELNNEIDQLHTQLRILTEENTKIGLENRALSNVIEHLEQSISNKNDLEKQMLQEICSLKRESSDMCIEKETILADSNKACSQLLCSLDVEKSKNAHLSDANKRLTDDVEQSHQRIAFMESKLNTVSLERDSIDEGAQRKLLEAHAIIKALQTAKTFSEAEVHRSHEEIASIRKINDDQLVQINILQEVLNSREHIIHSLMLELQQMGAKLKAPFEDEPTIVQSFIEGQLDEIASRTLHRHSVTEQVEYMVESQKVGQEKKTKSHIDGAMDQCEPKLFAITAGCIPITATLDNLSSEHNDLSLKHSKLLEELRSMKQNIVDVISSHDKGKVRTPSDHEILNTSIEFERDLLLMEIEKRDKLLQRTSEQITGIIGRVSNITELLQQKDELLLIFSERAEYHENERETLKNSLLSIRSSMEKANAALKEESHQREMAESEISSLRENVSLLETQIEKLNSTVERLQGDTKSAVDEAIQWKKRFFGNDEKWSVKMEASQELSRCFFALVGAAAMVKKNKIARLGVAFGTWKKVSSGYKYSKVDTQSTVIPNESSISLLGSSRIAEGDEKVLGQIRVAAARIITRNLSKHIMTVEARAFRRWSCVVSRSRAVTDHLNVAEEMANQLDATRLKLNLLRQHLQDAGILESLQPTVKKSNKGRLRE